MSVTTYTFETKPVPHEVILVERDRLDDIAAYIGASRIENVRNLNGLGRHGVDRVTFAKANGIYATVLIGDYLVRDMTNENATWRAMSIEEVNGFMNLKSDPKDHHIYPPYDR